MPTLNILGVPERQSNLALATSNKRMGRQSLLRMICLAACVVCAATPADAQQTKIVHGSEISLSSIAKATWVQGGAPTSFEPENVYIFECWSTLCGPCIGMIPHVNELHEKYYDQGLRIYGMSVYENDISKVKEFLQEKGDGMSYPVAFTGKGGAFETEIFKPAGGKGIPHAFIVRNGKLLVSTQASRLTESLIETLLSGDEGAQEVYDMISAEQKHQAEIDGLMNRIRAAQTKKDTQAMTVHIEALKVVEPGLMEIAPLELQVLIIDEEWAAAVKALNEMPATEARTSFVSMNSMRAARNDSRQGYSKEFLKALVDAYFDYVMYREYPVGPNHFACLSILQWELGDQQAAKVTAEKGVQRAISYVGASEARTEAFNKFLESVNKGSMPSVSDLSKWQREARAKDVAK